MSVETFKMENTSETDDVSKHDYVLEMCKWFMALDEPTASQSAFVSVVMGVMTGVFGIWMGHEHKGDSHGSNDKK